MTEQFPPPPPNPVPVGTAPGGLLERFLARLIDSVIVGIVSGIIMFAVFANIFTDTTTVLGVTVDNGYTYGFYLFSALVQAALWFGYFVFFETSTGATLGKTLLKLKVVGPDGSSHPTVQQSVMRNVWGALGLLGILGAVGQTLGGLAQLAAVIVIAVQINSNLPSRRHFFDDLAGGTQVLKVG
ncbi:RDD family protein [soil metagenome]